MPEGPELFLSSVFINRICHGLIFSGKAVRNPIHKCQDINWDEAAYTISAESRGKELMLHLRSCYVDDKKQFSPTGGDKVLSILFTFGMSGKFEFVAADNLAKHSHLTFFTKDDPKMGLAFIDYRRFGKWVQGGRWSSERGPCVIQEHTQFVNHVAANLDKSAFNKPICEVMLNQRFFNGIGNYLRAEILYRCNIVPFEKARSVLELIDSEEHPKMKSESLEANLKIETVKKELQNGDRHGVCNGSAPLKRISKNKTGKSAGKEFKVEKEETAEELNYNESSTKDIYNSFTLKGQELLKLCGSVPLEVIDIGSTKSSLSEMYKDDTMVSFNHWLQCYYQEGMKSLADHNKRTIWFSGSAGPMAPKAVEKVKGKGKKKGKKSSSKIRRVTNKNGGTQEANTPEIDVKSTSKTLTRKKLKELKMKASKTPKKEPNRDIRGKAALSESSHGRKRKNKVKDSVVKKKVQRNEIGKDRFTCKRLTRSSMTIDV